MLDLIILKVEFYLNDVFDVCIFSFSFLMGSLSVSWNYNLKDCLSLTSSVATWCPSSSLLVVNLNFWSNKEIVAESWVEVSDLPISPAPFDRGQAAQGPDDYLRLLREAQRESNQSSALVSLASTRKNSPHSSWVELFKYLHKPLSWI